MITPAISVLSAVEGLQVAAPSLDSLVLPIALAVLTVLFSIQRFGTKAVGRLFGPVMALWFSVLALAGFAEVIQSPAILKALSPSYGVAFFLDNGVTAFLALGSWYLRSLVPRPSTPIWATLAARRYAGRGSCSCFPRSPSTTWARGR